MPQKSKKTTQNRKEPISKPRSEIKRKVYEFDATDKILGRFSTEVANILRGKNKPTFVPYKNMGDKVVIKNAAKIKVTGAKLTQKLYYRHSGYIGHLKVASLDEKMRRDPSEVIKRSILGMLPKNKLRKLWMKNLTIYNGDTDAAN